MCIKEFKEFSKKFRKDFEIDIRDRINSSWKSFVQVYSSASEFKFYVHYFFSSTTGRKKNGATRFLGEALLDYIKISKGIEMTTESGKKAQKIWDNYSQCFYISIGLKQFCDVLSNVIISDMQEAGMDIQFNKEKWFNGMYQFLYLYMYHNHKK